MDMNNSSINNISQNQEPVNKENWSVCPECIGLIGSIKRNWMENHSDYIISTYDTMGYEYACHYFRCKPDTMLRFLNRHDLGDQKLIRRDEITRNRVGLIDTKVYDLVKLLDRQDLSITELENRGYQLTDIMLAWHERQAHDHKIMAEYLKSLTPGLTYQQEGEPRLKVSPTLQNVDHKEIKSIDTGLTSVNGSDRYSVFINKRTGKQSTSRSDDTRLSPKQRYEQSKRRGSRRV